MQLFKLGVTGNFILSFTFNGGSEADNEISGIGNSLTTHFRELDTRLGRWWTIDIKSYKYPGLSPYILSHNNPIFLNDPLGDDPPNDIFKIIVEGKKSKVFSDLIHENKINRLNYFNIISTSNREFAITETMYGRITLKNTDDIKYNVIQLTQELTNRKNIDKFNELEELVKLGKISPKVYAKRVAQVEVEGQINQIKVAADIGFRFKGDDAATKSFNKLIDEYSKNNKIDLKKRVKASTAHLKLYENQGKSIRNYFLKYKI